MEPGERRDRIERMTLAEFRASVQQGAAPSADQAPLLQALWHDARGDWDRAHEVAQGVETPDGAWVHAYLHRKEGDPDNARYWYGRAGRPVSRASLDEEWNEIAGALLARA
jgi:hypothetical protein